MDRHIPPNPARCIWNKKTGSKLASGRHCQPIGFASCVINANLTAEELVRQKFTFPPNLLPTPESQEQRTA
jgi:hypothetical protein